MTLVTQLDMCLIVLDFSLVAGFQFILSFLQKEQELSIVSSKEMVQIAKAAK